MKEIVAKQLLSHSKTPDAWFGHKYNMNLYRGCEHRCIYCDSRSECYGIEDYDELQVKVNALDLLRKELSSKRVKGTVGTGSMSDPYTPSEAKLGMTRQALEILAEWRFPVHILTKSDMVARDTHVLTEIAKIYAAVSFTITTADDNLARKLEPAAPSPSRRLEAMRVLSEAGVYCGVIMMPVLPYLEDDEKGVLSVVRKGAEAGGSYVLPSIGMTLRDRQREYYYRRLDDLFPGKREQYQARYGAQYQCPANRARHLDMVVREECYRLGLTTHIEPYTPDASEQLDLL